MLNHLRRIAPAIALFFLSPLIGEFLLGNLSIDKLSLAVADFGSA